MKKVARISLRFAGWAATLAAVVVVLGVLALMVGPRVVGWQGLIIFTGSMEPALKVGGVAFVEPLSNPEEVRVGDIIAYRSLRDRQKLISHRVIEIVADEDGLRFRTKGDASELPDQEPIPAENLVGKVRFHVPYAGYAADKLRHREYFYLLVGIPAALIIAGELWNIARAVRHGRREQVASTAQEDTA